MTPFLEQVANAYIEHERDNLADYCFVFPTRRASVFFTYYLTRNCGASASRPMLSPTVLTVDQFMESMVPDRAKTSPYDELFTLYNCYRSISPDALDFDRFHFWGEMLMSDFLDVDRYLVDAEQLFTNVTRLHEINSTYLTPEQLEIIKQYFGEDRPDYGDRFWTHAGGNDTPGGKAGEHEEKFKKLWEVLGRLYEEYTQTLGRKGLASPGIFYRLAYENIKAKRRGALRAERYIFVGFGMLSTSELLIMQMLKAMGAADFYWDTDIPSVRSERNSNARRILLNAKLFPSLYELPELKVEEMGSVDVCGIPSRTGQAKYAAKALTDLVKNKRIKDPFNAKNTAVVLTDETLLEQVLSSLPREFKKVNVTLGLPARTTPVASLLRRVLRMHLLARKNKEGFCYRYSDVLVIVSHPLLRGLDPEQCLAVHNLVRREHRFMISAEALIQAAPSLAPAFRPINDQADLNEAFDYIAGVIEMLRGLIGADNKSLETNILNAYADDLEELRVATRTFGVAIKEATAFQLLEKALSATTIHLKGKPVDGLQIMGMPETRCLDFDNVIVLSLNEGGYPQRRRPGSFIPVSLRHAYKMPTPDTIEATYSYNLYRLLSRASSATLTYDSRSIGPGAGEPSRYLYQLLYLFNGIDADGEPKISHKSLSYKGNNFAEPEICVSKNQRVMQKLSRFKADGSGKFLSASALKKYLNCPLDFYLTYVEEVAPADEITDYIDASAFGTILHDSMQDLYNSLSPDPSTAAEPEVTDRIIQGWIDSPTIIDRIVTHNVNKVHVKSPDLDAPLQGDAFAIAQLVKDNMKGILKQDLKIVPFRFVAAEYPSIIRMEVTPEITINIKQYIDRIDRTARSLRIVDYKTGGDKTKANMEELFNSDHYTKAIFQLLLYCNVYSLAAAYDGPIQPIIYKVKSAFSPEGFEPIKVNSQPLYDYHAVNDEFMVKFTDLIRRIFDSEEPFVQAEKEDACKYCKFKSLCGRG